MWYLEIIGDDPEPFDDDYLLNGIDDATLKRVLQKANPEYSDEYLDPFSYEIVNLEALSELVEYLDEPPEVNASFYYYITYYDD